MQSTFLLKHLKTGEKNVHLKTQFFIGQNKLSQVFQSDSQRLLLLQLYSE